MVRSFLPLIFALAAALPALPVQAEERSSNSASGSFLGRLSGKSEDFADLKRQRRQLNNDINRAERDLRSMDSEIERLGKELEGAPTLLNRLEQEIKLIDAVLSEKNTQPPKPPVAPKVGVPAAASASRFPSEREFLSSQPSEELRSRKADREQRGKEINERIQRLALLKNDHKKKRDELDAKQAALVDLEDRIGVALNVGTNQYIYIERS